MAFKTNQGFKDKLTTKYIKSVEINKLNKNES